MRATCKASALPRIPCRWRGRAWGWRRGADGVRPNGPTRRASCRPPTRSPERRHEDHVPRPWAPSRRARHAVCSAPPSARASCSGSRRRAAPARWRPQSLARRCRRRGGGVGGGGGGWEGEPVTRSWQNAARRLADHALRPRHACLPGHTTHVTNFLALKSGCCACPASMRSKVPCSGATCGTQGGECERARRTRGRGIAGLVPRALTGTTMPPPTTPRVPPATLPTTPPTTPTTTPPATLPTRLVAVDVQQQRRSQEQLRQRLHGRVPQPIGAHEQHERQRVHNGRKLAQVADALRVVGGHVTRSLARACARTAALAR